LQFCMSHKLPKFGECSIVKNCCRFEDCYELPTWGEQNVKTHCDEHAKPLMRKEPQTKCKTDYCDGNRKVGGLCSECYM
jgi:hypothetical protein